MTKEKIEEEVGVLLIVDPLKDFFYEYIDAGGKEKGKFYSKNAKAIIPSIVELARKRLIQRWLIVRIVDEHQRDDLEVELLGRHAMHHTRGAEIINELSALESQPNVVTIYKHTFDSFLGRSDKPLYGKNLEEIIRKAKPTVVEIAGVCTDICVREAASQLIARRNARKFNRNMKVVIYRDCVATSDEAEGDRALNHLKKWFGVKIIDEAPK